MPFKTKMSLRAVFTREANTIRLGRDALNALYKLVFIVMQMLKLSQMLKLLARNMTFSFKKQAYKSLRCEGYKKIRKEELRNKELKAFRKLGIQYTLSIIKSKLQCFQLRNTLNGKNFKFFSHGLINIVHKML